MTAETTKTSLSAIWDEGRSKKDINWRYRNWKNNPLTRLLRPQVPESDSIRADIHLSISNMPTIDDPASNEIKVVRQMTLETLSSINQDGYNRVNVRIHGHNLAFDHTLTLGLHPNNKVIGARQDIVKLLNPFPFKIDNPVWFSPFIRDIGLRFDRDWVDPSEPISAMYQMCLDISHIAERKNPNNRGIHLPDILPWQPPNIAGSLSRKACELFMHEYLEAKRSGGSSLLTLAYLYNSLLDVIFALGTTLKKYPEKFPSPGYKTEFQTHDHVVEWREGARFFMDDFHRHMPSFKSRIFECSDQQEVIS